MNNSYEVLNNLVCSFNRDMSEIRHGFEEITDLKVFSGLDMGVNCKNRGTYDVLKKLSLDNVFTFNRNDEDIIVCVAIPCEEYMDNIVSSMQRRLDESGCSYIDVFTNEMRYLCCLDDDSDVCMVILGYDYITIKKKDFNFKFSYSVLNILGDVLDSALDYSDEFLALLTLNSNLSTDELINTTFLSKDNYCDFVLSLYNNKDYTYDFIARQVNIVRNSNIDTESLFRNILLSRSLYTLNVRHDTIYNWCRLIVDDNFSFVSVSLRNKGVFINQYKDLPKLISLDITYAYSLDIDGTQLSKYISKDKSLFRKPYKIDAITLNPYENEYYCDGNLSRERAVSKFIGVLKSLNADITKYQIYYDYCK